MQAIHCHRLLMWTASLLLMLAVIPSLVTPVIQLAKVTSTSTQAKLKVSALEVSAANTGASLDNTSKAVVSKTSALPTVTTPDSAVKSGSQKTDTSTTISSTTSSSNSKPVASKTDSSVATATAAPTTTPKTTSNDCSTKDACLVGGKNCLSLSYTSICSQFHGILVPTNLADFFKARGDTSNRFNTDLADGPAFDTLFTKFQDNLLPTYSKHVFGCTALAQKWLITSICLDMVDYYRSNGDACASSGSMPMVCPSFFTERSESLTSDLNNQTQCPVSAEAKLAGMDNVQSLQQSQYKAPSESGCIDAKLNENYKNTRQCGYFYAATPCERNDCQTSFFISEIQPNCSDYVKQGIAIRVDEDSDSTSKSKTPVTAIVLGTVGALALVAGIFALFRVRTRCADAEKTTEVVKTASLTRSNSNISTDAEAFNNKPPTEAYEPMHRNSAGSSTTLFSQPNQFPVNVPAAATLAMAATKLPESNEQTQQTVTVDYQKTQEDELTMTLGNVAVVYESYEDGWAYGRNLTTNREGFFPMTCFQDIPELQQADNAPYEQEHEQANARYQSLTRHTDQSI